MAPSVRARLELVPSAQEWDREVSALPTTHFLQSATWSRFKSAYGWHCERYRLTTKAGTIGWASILSRSLGPSPFRLAYVPRGPLLISEASEDWAAALTSLEDLARRRRWLLLKVDPEVRSEAAASELASVLSQRGWRRGEEVQFRNTVVADIRGSEDQVLSRMKPKTRYNVRLARRRGVQVGQAEEADFGRVYALYRDTAVRDGFIVRPRRYYELLWSALTQAGMGAVLEAVHEGLTLAALVVVAYGDTAWYVHGASLDQHRNLMPTYLLQWEAIRWARARGCSRYDMWGAPATLDERDPMAGVLRFKTGFGGEFTPGVGAWDYAPRPWLYRLYGSSSRALLALWRRWRRRTQKHE